MKCIIIMTLERTFKSYNENALFLEECSSLHQGIDQTKVYYSTDDQFFLISWLKGKRFLCWGMVIHSFHLLVYSGAWIRQFKYIFLMIKEGSTKIVNFMTHGTGVLMLGCGHMSFYWKCIIFYSINKQHIDCYKWL